MTFVNVASIFMPSVILSKQTLHLKNVAECDLKMCFSEMCSGWSSPQLKGWSRTRPSGIESGWTLSWTGWPVSFRFQRRSRAAWTNSPSCGWVSVICVLKTSSHVSSLSRSRLWFVGCIMSFSMWLETDSTVLAPCRNARSGRTVCYLDIF